MVGVILIIDDYDYTSFSGQLSLLAISEGFDEFAFAQTDNIDDALKIFFDQLPLLIILNEKIKGVHEALQTIKEEEIYRHVPVVTVMQEYDSDLYRKFHQIGSDAVLTYREVEDGYLVLRARPLIVTSALFQTKIKRSSELEENNLMDFILLDLIRPYVSRSVWEIAQENAKKQKIQISTQEKELTIAFGDIKSFTSVSEKMNPKGVIKFLNVAYDVVTRHIFNQGGDIDKFIGDAFLAVFDDPAAAIKSMAAIQRELAQTIKDTVVEDNDEPIASFRIAVHSGRVIRGNVGGNERYDNTLIGGIVNLCSRLEHEAPVGGLLVSEETGIKAGLEIPRNEMLVFHLRGLDKETHAFSFFDMIEKGFIQSREWLC